MTSLDFLCVCCVCLESGKELHLVHTTRKSNEPPLNTMLYELTGINVEEHCDVDLIPDKICQKCEIALVQAYTFRLKVLQAQQQIIDNCTQQPKRRNVINHEDTHEASIAYLTEDIIECDAEIQYERHISDDPLRETPKKYPAPVQLTRQLKNDPNTFTKKVQAKLKTNIAIVKCKKIPKRNERTKHICETCGNIYLKRSCLLEHRKRHNKELIYACEFCDKRFYMPEILRRHVLTHSGSKPYKCTYCSRTFFYLSAQKAHEAVHSGIKPHICSVCNKAFAYAHSLKKHELIHADIKLYYCKYCDKEFRLQHHMKQHEETKAHQKTVAAAGATDDGLTTNAKVVPKQ